jgi:plastocyanin
MARNSWTARESVARVRTKRVALAGLILLAASIGADAGPAGGTVKGTVTCDGAPPKMKPVVMSKDPSCAKMYSTPPLAETIVAGTRNGLENVVVFISAGAPNDEAPSTVVAMAQKGCRYIPHLLAFQVNQKLIITNEDQTVHNVHAVTKLNREWNVSQLPGAPAIREQFDEAEFIPVKCNVHPWMHATFAVLKNSHYAVTGDGGGFSLPDLPPGKYKITAWHESYGEQSQSVTIAGKETKTINFVFTVKPL